jgi:hypothetical protein
MSQNQKSSLFSGLALAVLLAGVLFAIFSWQDAPAPAPGPAPAPVVEQQQPDTFTASPDQLKNLGGTREDGELRFGYTPRPAETRAFVQSLPRPFLAQAGPEVLAKAQDQKPVLLYRALYEAYAKFNGNAQWKVGKQGIGDCFIAGTLVRMYDGRETPIEKVEVGDIVYSHALRWQKVTRTIAKQSKSRLVTIKAKGYPEVTATVDHRFIRAFNDTWKWTPASHVWIGDKLLTITDQPVRGPPSAQWSEIESAEILNKSGETTVYCLEVETDHSFFANGYAVHNCVSWGWKHGIDILLAVMLKQGDTGEWKEAATESLYGGGRVEARGVKQGGWSDGSYGAAEAKWVSKDGGVTFRQPYAKFDLSKYSAVRAKDWGNYGNGGKDDNGDFDKIAREHQVKSVVLIRNFREASAAIQSGYPIPVCSGQGFSSTRDKDGFARASGRWAHCMCFIGVRFDRPGLLCLNSWGTNWINGPVFPEDQPAGSFWVDASVVDSMLRGEDSFAVSGYEGFPYRNLTHGDWVLVEPTQVRQYLARTGQGAEEREQLANYSIAP